MMDSQKSLRFHFHVCRGLPCLDGVCSFAALSFRFGCFGGSFTGSATPLFYRFGASSFDFDGLRFGWDSQNGALET